MNEKESFNDLSYTDEMHMAERELFAFVCAVKELFGMEQARVAAEDWLDESELMDSPPQSTSRNWRAISVAASAKLADRLTVARQRQARVGAPADMNLLPSSNCFAPRLLMRGRPSSS